MPKVSIVTKTYNRCAFLKECINSVQNLINVPFEKDIQWEHVIYDDGSEDETPDFCKTHPLPHVRYVRSEENEGISVAGNKAIATCDSDWIFELDSDDLAPSRILANWLVSLRQNPQSEWFVMDFYRMDASGRYEVGSDYYGWDFANTKEVLQNIFSAKHFIQHNVIYKRRLWQEVHGYNQNLGMAEDLEMYVRFLLKGSMPKYAPFISHFHRNHQSNLSRDVTLERHKNDLKEIYRMHTSQLKQIGINPEIEQ